MSELINRSSQKNTPKPRYDTGVARDQRDPSKRLHLMSPVADPTIGCWRWSCKTWRNHDEVVENVKL